MNLTPTSTEKKYLYDLRSEVSKNCPSCGEIDLWDAGINHCYACGYGRSKYAIDFPRRKCIGCEQNKPDNRYYFDQRRKEGLCKICERNLNSERERRVRKAHQDAEGIYLIGDEHGRVKIGVFAFVPESRLTQLQTGNADALQLLDYVFVKDAYKVEAELHEKYDHLKVRGEWFQYTPEISLEHLKQEVSFV